MNYFLPFILFLCACSILSAHSERAPIGQDQTTVPATSVLDPELPLGPSLSLTYPFEKGLLPFTAKSDLGENRIGYKDTSGQVIITARFRKRPAFTPAGYAVVFDGGMTNRTGLLLTDGTYLIPPRYSKTRITSGLLRPTINCCD